MRWPFHSVFTFFRAACRTASLAPEEFNQDVTAESHVCVWLGSAPVRSFNLKASANITAQAALQQCAHKRLHVSRLGVFHDANYVFPVACVLQIVDSLLKLFHSFRNLASCFLPRVTFVFQVGDVSFGLCDSPSR